MSNRVMGRAQIKVNGQLLLTHKGATLEPGGPDRTTVSGGNSIHGFTEQVMPAKLECEISVKADTSLAQIGRWTDVTVTFEADTGQTYVIAGGWVLRTPSVKDDDGKAKITIEGPPAEEML